MRKFCSFVALHLTMLWRTRRDILSTETNLIDSNDKRGEMTFANMILMRCHSVHCCRFLFVQLLITAIALSSNVTAVVSSDSVEE